jgi:GTPase SAR1 family protein
MASYRCACHETEELKKHRLIEAQLREEREFIGSFKILCTGTGDSGKTTLSKQMKILHMEGYTNEEKEQFIPIIIRNIVEHTKLILEKMWEDGIQLKTDTYLIEDRENIIRTFQYAAESDYKKVPATLAVLIKTIIKHEEFWACFDKHASYLHISDGSKYLLERIEEICKKDYMPIHRDILHAKVITQGIWETRFKVNNYPFIMYDIGGQRMERKKWCSIYDDISCVISVVAISEYDQLLREDSSTNRLHESIKVFRELTQNKKLKEKPIILCLNKVDLFEIKINTIPLTRCFPECPPDIANDAKAAKIYIKNKLWEHKTQEERENPLYLTKFTHATDTTNIKTIIEAVKTFCFTKDL